MNDARIINARIINDARVMNDVAVTDVAVNYAAVNNAVGVMARNAAAQNASLLSGSAPSRAPQPAAFLNLIHFLLQPDSFVQGNGTAPEVQPASDGGSAPDRAALGREMTASPAQIADALVRAMLGTGSTPGAGSTSETMSRGTPVPRAAIGAGKNDAEGIPPKRPSSNAGAPTTAATSLPPPNPATPVPPNAANPGAANPGAAPDPSSWSVAASSSADPSGAAPSSGHPAPAAGTAFEARLTPKTDDPDPPSLPGATFSPMPAAPSNSGAKRDVEQDSGSNSAGGDAASQDMPGNADAGSHFMSHAVQTFEAAGASGGVTAPAPAPAGPQHVAPAALPEPVAPPVPISVREMTMRIAAPDTPAVDVQVNQRQGEVYVAVRTADPVLQASLRQDLPQLVNALDRAGFRTETFVPPAAGEARVSSAAEASPSSSTPDSPADSRRDSRQDSQPEPRQEASGQPNRQQQQPRQREQMHTHWLKQMEE